MLHAPLRPTAAKLDISRLLESDPTPEKAVPARSVSDPPPARSLPPSGRSSISSTHSGGSSYAALSASSLPQLVSQQPQPGAYPHHRPRIPSLSALPLPAHSLPPVEQQPRHPSHALSTSSLPDPAAFSYPQPPKRPAPSDPHPSASPAKRQSKWTAEEDALVIELRGAGMKWEDISKRIPGRTPLSCRLHYQNYIERRSQWDEDRKNRLARLYERLKPEMWKPLAAELNVPWRAAEAMHWYLLMLETTQLWRKEANKSVRWSRQLGQAEMARRAGVTPFSISGGPGGSGGRLEAQQMVETSPSTSYPPPSPYAGAYGPPSLYAQPVTRQGYFEDQKAEPSFKTPAYGGRPRSISASSSGEDRRGSGSIPGSAPWPGPPGGSQGSGLGSDRPRFGSESWPLPRLPEQGEGEDQAAPQEVAGSSQQHTPRHDAS